MHVYTCEEMYRWTLNIGSFTDNFLKIHKLFKVVFCSHFLTYCCLKELPDAIQTELYLGIIYSVWEIITSLASQVTRMN